MNNEVEKARLRASAYRGLAQIRYALRLNEADPGKGLPMPGQSRVEQLAGLAEFHADLVELASLLDKQQSGSVAASDCSTRTLELLRAMITNAERHLSSVDSHAADVQPVAPVPGHPAASYVAAAQQLLAGLLQCLRSAEPMFSLEETRMLIGRLEEQLDQRQGDLAALAALVADTN